MGGQETVTSNNGGATPANNPFMNGTTSLASQGFNFLNQLVMPSMGEFKKLANQGEKKRLLREIKSATIEKLTNKIIKSFAMESAFITPFLLLICL